MSRLLKIKLLCIGLLALAWGCNAPKSLNRQNLSSLYTQKQQRLHPKFKVYHASDSQSEIYLMVQTQNLLYALNPKVNAYEAKLQVHYEIFKTFEDLAPIDSATTTLSDQNYGNPNTAIVGKFNIKAEYGKMYYVRFTLTDLNRQTVETALVTLDKLDFLNRYNFKLTNKGDSKILFDYHIAPWQPVEITFNQPEAKELFIQYFNRDFGLPLPPFAMYNPKQFDYQPDSILLATKTEHGTFSFNTRKPGIYHLSTGTGQRNGLTLYYFDEHFPKTETAESLIEPLRYLTKKQEYEALEKAENKKKAVDAFWLGISPNKSRARELIKTYYNRVQNANLYFSSMVPGWKTDRGLIYIIYGEPDVIYKNEGGESWIYGEEGAYLSVNFNFVQVQNPFTDNDFRLNRTPMYKESWYKAIEAWRDGRVAIQ